MGDEADRFIDGMIYKWRPAVDKLTTRLSHRGSVLNAGRIVQCTKNLGSGKQVVKFDGLAGQYICTTDTELPSGTAVTVDGNFHAKPIAAVMVMCKPVKMNTDISILFEGFDDPTTEHPSTVVKTNIVCSYCQKAGLHWSGQKGINLHLRDENGFRHDCGRSKVTINL